MISFAYGLLQVVQTRAVDSPKRCFGSAVAASVSDTQLRQMEGKCRKSNDKFRRDAVDVPPAI